MDNKIYIRIDDDFNDRRNRLEQNIKDIEAFFNIEISGDDTEEKINHLIDKCFHDGYQNTIYFTNAIREYTNKKGENKIDRKIWLRPDCDNMFINDNLNGKSLSFRGYIREGFFVINEIVIVDNYYDVKDGIEDKIEAIVHHTEIPNEYRGDFLNEKLDETESVCIKAQEKLKEWRDYLKWRKKLVEKKLIGIKYKYEGFDEENQEIQFKLISLSKEDFDKIKRILKKNTLEIFDNSYSKDEINFNYNDKHKNKKSLQILGKLSGDFKEIKLSQADDETQKHYKVFASFKISNEYFEKDENEQVNQKEIDEVLKNYQDGFLALNQVGDFALINRLENAISKVESDESFAPNLILWLFDIAKANIPSDSEINKEYDWDNKKLNKEQKIAVQKMLATKDICLIQGPPGTGKTTVIAEAIYQFVKNNERVLLASQTNLAVDNALERLSKNPLVKAIRLNPSKATDDIKHLTEKEVLGYFFENISNKINDEYLQKWESNSKKINEIRIDIRDYKSYLEQFNDNANKENDYKDTIVKFKSDLQNLNIDIKNLETKNEKIKREKREVENFIDFIDSPNNNLGFILPFDLAKKLLYVINNDLDNLKDIKIDILNINQNMQEYELSKCLQEIYKNILCFIDIEKRLEHLDLNNFTAENIDLQNQLTEIKNRIADAKDEEEFIKLKKQRDELENKLKNSFVLNEFEKRIFNISDIKKVKNQVKDNEKIIKKLQKDFINFASECEEYLSGLDEIKINYDEVKIVEGKFISNKNELEKVVKFKKDCEENLEKIRIKYNLNNLESDLALKSLDEELQKLDNEKNNFKFVQENYGQILKDFDNRLKNMDLNMENEYYLNTYINSCNVVGVSCTDNPKILEDKGFNAFDVVIIDEVSKATPPELILPILKSKKVILVGDHRQLPPLFGENNKTYNEICEDLDDEDEIKELLTPENFKKYEKMVTASIFKEYFEKADQNIKHTLLEQFRMHEQIMNVINRFYENRLIAGLPREIERDEKNHKLEVKGVNGLNFIETRKHVYWINSSKLILDNKEKDIFELKESTSTSTYNILEVYLTIELLKMIDEAYDKIGLKKKVQVGVVNLYQLQVNKIRSMLKDKKNNIEFKSISVDVNTVDRFQGKEKEIIIANLVRNPQDKKVTSHITAFERVNVMFSRAQKALFIIGAKDYFEKIKIKLPKMGSRGYDIKEVYKDIIEDLGVSGIFMSDRIINNNLANKIYQEYKAKLGKENEQ